MDVLKILQELRAQREKLVQTIAQMEAFVHANGSSLPSVPAKRRGRKFMGSEERQEVSKRMHRYWESRRKTASGAGAEEYLRVFELNTSQGDHSS